MRTMKKYLLFGIWFFGIRHGLTMAADKAFSGTGVFQGQGRGCWGKLYITEKSLEWNTPYSVCKKTAYSVIQKNLIGKSPHIAFALAQKSKNCGFEIIELSFDSEYPAYWLANGYATRKVYANRRVADEHMSSQILSCSVQKTN